MEANYPLDARAGSLWHKTAGEAIPRNSPRHGGGPVCMVHKCKCVTRKMFHTATEPQSRTKNSWQSQAGTDTNYE